MVEEPPATRLNRLADATVTRKGQVQLKIVRTTRVNRYGNESTHATPVAPTLRWDHGSGLRQGTMRGDNRCATGTDPGSSISMAIWVHTVRHSVTACSLWTR